MRILFMILMFLFCTSIKAGFLASQHHKVYCFVKVLRGEPITNSKKYCLDFYHSNNSINSIKCEDLNLLYNLCESNREPFFSENTTNKSMGRYSNIVSIMLVKYPFGIWYWRPQDSAQMNSKLYITNTDKYDKGKGFEFIFEVSHIEEYDAEQRKWKPISFPLFEEYDKDWLYNMILKWGSNTSN